MAAPRLAISGQGGPRKQRAHLELCKRTVGSAAAVYVRNDGDDDLVVFCFAAPEDAEAFRERFGGERLP
jgi:hypothetical protein